MPTPPKLTPPDPAEVHALAMHYAKTGPMPWTLAIHKAESHLRERNKTRARNVQFTSKHRQEAANRIGVPSAWI